MTGRRRRQRIGAWLAFFAIALNALAPLVSQAASFARGAPLGLPPLEGQAPRDGPSAGTAAHAGHHHAGGHGAGTAHGAGHGGHCPFCFVHAGSFALPPVAAALRLPPAAASKSCRAAACEGIEGRAPHALPPSRGPPPAG